MTRLIAVFTALVLAGCASAPPTQSTAVRTRAPVGVESTVSSYFDLTLPGPQTNRKLAIGAPETSDCPLGGKSGSHLGWVVPVIYDTSPAPAAPPKTVGTSAAPVAAKNVAKTGAVKANSAAAAKTAAVAATADPAPAASTSTDAVTLRDVSLSGTRYFFWFSSDTLSAVSRRMDLCP
jgi:hypothetical protein